MRTLMVAELSLFDGFATYKFKCQCTASHINRADLAFPFGIGDNGHFLNEWYENFCQQKMAIPRLKKD